MTAITDKANEEYRDRASPGSSAEHWPEKPGIRELFAVIDIALASLGVNGAITVKKATLALLNADLAHAADTLAVVYNDATAENNGIYAKVGGSGSGSWSLTSLALPASFVDDLAEVMAQIGEVAADRIATEAARDLALAAQAAAESASDIAVSAVEDLGVVNFFDTYAAANAAVGSLDEGSVVQVFVDENEDDQRTYYRVESGALVLKLVVPVAADSAYFKSEPGAFVVRNTPTGVGIGSGAGVFPNGMLQVGPNNGVSSPYIIFGPTISGSQPSFGHIVSDFTNFSGPSVGGGDYAACGYDIRWQISGGTWDHIAGVQVDPQIFGAAVIADGYSYHSGGDISGGAAVTQYRHRLTENMNGNIGTQYGDYISALTALTQTWAYFVASDDNPSRLARVGICTSAPPSQALDINAPAGLPAAVVFRVGMTAYGFFGVARTAGDFGIATAVGDFIVRLQSKPFLLTADGGVSITFRHNSNGDTTVTGALIAGTTLRSGVYTVATLPVAGSSGRRAAVSDATAPTFLGTLTGGGAVSTPVYDNGTAWVAA